MNKIRISAVLITYNEQANIVRTLESLTWCDEIVVIDSGSTDNTVELCEQRGCRVMYHAFSGFGEQKRFAVHQAMHDWILSVDADEVITRELQDEIVGIFNRGEIDCAGFYLPRTLVFMGRVFRHGNENMHGFLRLFDRRCGGFTNVLVHEAVETQGKTRHLQGIMLHYSYLDIEQYFTKFNRYTSMAARQLHAKGRSTNRVLIVVRFPITFFQTYFLKANFLNGFPGFVWSLFCGIYPVVKYLKLYELASKPRQTR
jgi:glycosyltransferase involved in cell wall biosynthesis